MKNTLKYLALASAMLFGFGACVEKAPEYEPADQVGNSEVFFAPNLPSTYNLKGNPGKFSFDISRVDASNSVTVSLSSSADAIFSIPSSVSFSSGSKTAPVEVTFDPSKLKEDTPYPFTVTITNETTPYGASEYSFTTSIPAAWIKFAKGTMTESPDFWGETERETMYYQDIAPGVRYCYISDCFDTETVKAGDPYDPVNYYFYWYFDPEAEGAPDHAPGKLRVLPQYMGYTNSSGQMWFSDNQAFYEDYFIETKENVLSDIGITLLDEKDTFVPIINGGKQWYNTYGKLNVIMDDTDKITIVYKDHKTNEEKRETVRIHGLPKRPNKTTKLSLEVEFESPKEGAVIIKDLGFGKLFPTTNKIYRKEFKI